MVTQEQYIRVLRRLSAIEEHLNDQSVAMDKFVTLEQVQDLIVLLESSITALRQTVESLKTRTSILENETWK